MLIFKLTAISWIAFILSWVGLKLTTASMNSLEAWEFQNDDIMPKRVLVATVISVITFLISMLLSIVTVIGL